MNNKAFNKLSNVDCDAYKSQESESLFDDSQFIVQGDWIEERTSEDVNKSAHKDNSLADMEI
jgi:hypothetical protein